VADLVAEHARDPVEPGEAGERGRVGDDADLADRLHAVDGDEVVEQVERVLGAGEAQPGGERLRQPGGVHLLAAHHAGGIPVEEPHEPHAVEIHGRTVATRTAARTHIVRCAHAHRPRCV
jgi:hypothetical protein